MVYVLEAVKEEKVIDIFGNNSKSIGSRLQNKILEYKMVHLHYLMARVNPIQGNEVNLGFSRGSCKTRLGPMSDP